MRYGVKKLVLTELEQGGSIKAGGMVVVVDTPQEVSFDPQILEGNKTDLRGGDTFLGSIQEEDRLIGMNATFRDALLSYEAMKLIGGGALQGEAPDFTGYTAPTLSEQANPRSPFKGEIYCSRYPKGSHLEGSQAGYTKVTLWYAKGRVPSFSLTDRGFVVPSYTIRSTENTGLSKGPFSIEDVAALP